MPKKTRTRTIPGKANRLAPVLGIATPARSARPIALADPGELAGTSAVVRRSASALRLARARYRAVYQLRIELEELRPAIWRRLAVPEGVTLHEMHLLIQESMGWQNYHLYEFSTRHATFAEPDEDDDDCGRFVHDTRLVLLGDLRLREGSTLTYRYDFGDGWEHLITVEAIARPDAAQPVPACLDGARACPPEDVGGTSGYERMLEALADPDDDEHETFREWAGPRFDPEHFDPKLVNVFLKRPQSVWKKRLTGLQ